MRRLIGACGLAAMMVAGCGEEPGPNDPVALKVNSSTTTTIKAEPPKDDPASCRLAVGSEAIVRVPPAAGPNAVPFDKTPLMVANDEIGGMIESGTRVKVLEDKMNPYFLPMAADDTDGDVDRRFLEVEVIEGAERHKKGALPRNVLRPSK